VEFVLDASFTLHSCFEDEATPASDAVLTSLQNQADSAWVPAIWPQSRSLPLATSDDTLAAAAQNAGIRVLKP